MILKVLEVFEKKIIIFSRSVCLSAVRPSVARQSLESSSLPPPSVRFQSAVVGCGNTASATRLYCAFPRARACRAVRRVVLLPGACVRVRAVCCGARPVWRHSRTPQSADKEHLTMICAGLRSFLLTHCLRRPSRTPLPSLQPPVRHNIEHGNTKAVKAVPIFVKRCKR
ncbi:unnamed protein product [Aphis gossypii]|uniref:Uncharacterized protein n=1 Tax=Aphis gossypii TaxID=80765 RepID=A0A9P0N9U1_APHGO|nr:unnamed protein product [Aphis gossypii]